MPSGAPPKSSGGWSMGAGCPEERRIKLRIGVNLGDGIVEEHDIFGDGVNVSARLEVLAEPGGICISRVVRDQVRDKLELAFGAGEIDAPTCAPTARQTPAFDRRNAL
jgi:class 3 adenylate cyclase